MRPASDPRNRRCNKMYTYADTIEERKATSSKSKGNGRGTEAGQWLKTFGETKIIPQPVFIDPQWATDARSQPSDSEAQALRMEELCKAIHHQGKERWQRRWVMNAKTPRVLG